MALEKQEANFDRQCNVLNMLIASDIPDRTRPFVVVHGESPVAWFATFSDAGAFARDKFEPETYAIGDPSAAPDFLPMFFVQQPLV